MGNTALMDYTFLKAKSVNYLLSAN